MALCTPTNLSHMAPSLHLFARCRVLYEVFSDSGRVPVVGVPYNEDPIMSGFHWVEPCVSLPQLYGLAPSPNKKPHVANVVSSSTATQSAKAKSTIHPKGFNPKPQGPKPKSSTFSKPTTFNSKSCNRKAKAPIESIRKGDKMQGIAMCPAGGRV